jgi:hypothetical protein
MTKKLNTQVHEYSGQVISTPLNDPDCSLSGVEVNIN